MSKALVVMLAMAAVLTFTSMVIAADKISGEVTNYTVGKEIVIMDVEGKVHKLGITKKTNVMGDVKAGVKVDVEASGMEAKSISVQTAAAPKPEPAPVN
ncbi:MAG: hypothetical protein HZC10_01565 [Nitrospirae bacterium]|nr:hypothetical protein [Nitrospirota bacterium]